MGDFLVRLVCFWYGVFFLKRFFARNKCNVIVETSFWMFFVISIFDSNLPCSRSKLISKFVIFFKYWVFLLSFSYTEHLRCRWGIVFGIFLAFLILAPSWLFCKVRSFRIVPEKLLNQKRSLAHSKVMLKMADFEDYFTWLQNVAKAFEIMTWLI